MAIKECVLIGLLGMSLDAYAGCETDHDCKGDRVCNDGECEEPLSRPESPVATPAPSSTIDVEQARSLVVKTRRGAAATAVLFFWRGGRRRWQRMRRRRRRRKAPRQPAPYQCAQG